MTREEAINLLDLQLHSTPEQIEQYGSYEHATAIRMAIAALKAEPCEDAVSREAIETYVREYGEKHNGCNWIDNSVLYKFLKNLPSVTPARPKGKWIIQKTSEEGIFACGCMDCKMWMLVGKKTPNFCQNCGRDMRGGE